MCRNFAWNIFPQNSVWLLINCLDYMLRTSIFLMKEKFQTDIK